MSTGSNQKMFHCETCDTSMTGPANYQDHITGKKHLKKLKALGDLPEKFDQSAMPPSSTSSTPAAGYGGQFVKAAADTGEGVSGQGRGQFGLNVQGQVKGLSAQPPAPVIPTPAEILGTTNADPVMNAVKANYLGALPSKKLTYGRKCEVCNVDYTSASHEDQHLSGKKHKNKWALHKLNENAEEIKKGATFFCGFCNMNLNSPVQLDQHREGTAHLKKVAQARKSQEEGASAAKKTFVPSSETLPPIPPTTSPLELKPLTYDK
ncbi:zinc finger protein 346-like [Mya arenaria]|uniref:zinc finger protein 346-like n=1 Tax=Mya arenaria TaxID=6604 RepID=UPI0022E88727|nr:zinc finger protein 346-like [Mya arenaria]